MYICRGHVIKGNFSVFHLSKCPTSCFILYLPLDTHQISQENNGKINFCQCFMSSNVLRVRQPHIWVTSCSLGVTLLFHLMTRWSGNLGPLFFSHPQSLSTSSLINPFHAQVHRSTMEGQGRWSRSPTRRMLLKQGPKMLLEPTQDQQTSADKRNS